MEQPTESTEELSNKCKKLLIIAQRAKQAKDECLEELKKAKNLEKELQDKLSASHQEILSFQATSENLSGKISALEEILEASAQKIGDLEKSLSNSEKEKENWKTKSVDLQHKLKITEEKYALIELKLTDFQNKYLDEKNKYDKLETVLVKLEEKADKTGSDRSESRAEGLTTVPETEEFEAISQKLEDSIKTSDHLKLLNENLLQKVKILENELNAKDLFAIKFDNARCAFIEKCLDQCRELSVSCDKVVDVYTNLSSKSNDDLTLKDTQEVDTKYNEVIKQNDELLRQIKALESECSNLSEHNNFIQERVLNLEAENKSLHTLAEELKNNQNLEQMTEILKLNCVIDNMNSEIEVLKNENLASDDKFKALQDRFVEASRITDTLNQRCEEFSILKEKVDAYDSIAPKLQILWNDVMNSKKALAMLRGDFSSNFTGVMKDHSGFGKNLTKVVEDFTCQLVESNADLLSEMNMMNQALKERGETISTLEEINVNLRGEVSENDMRHKKFSEKYQLLNNEVSSLRTQLEGREKTIRDMEEEIWRLRSADSPADALSTSTISKVEESQRLSDLEGSFEERYNKLKALAVKLKKKVIEQQAEIEQERVKLVGERADFQTKITALKTQTNALSNLQAEYDALLDKSDNERKQSSELRKSLNKAREDAMTLKQQLEEEKNGQIHFQQEKSTFEMIKKELTAQIQLLKKSIEKEQGKVRQCELDKERWESDVKKVERELIDEKSRHKATLSALDEERQKQKKQSLLSLEMADYERTVQDMSKKLSVKDEQIRELTANLDTQRELSKTLQESVAGLESRVAVEQGTADSSKAKQMSLQEEVLRLTNTLNTTNAKLSDCERVAQEHLLDLDAAKLELTTVLAEHSKLNERFRTEQESLKIDIHNLEEKRASLQSQLDRRDLQLDELSKEFENYKVRAQSVLRQSQREGPPGRQLDIEQELAQLKASSDITKLKLEETLKNLELVKQDNALVANEKTRITKKLEQLENEVKELNVSNEQLQASEKRAQDAYDEAMRMGKIQQDTLSHCYKKEIEELEKKHEAELESCRVAQQKAETALQLHVKRPASPPTHRRVPSSGGDQRKHTSSGFMPVRSERETLDVLMLEREACEGSESVDSSSPRVVPLEQLLLPQPPVTFNYSHLVEKLEKYESRIQHLTSLLSDAERDGARLEQLNQVLKEEIRRKERNTAREEHASNLEYLKNIVIKFATLPRGDERLRLVPVLNTILKFSREEEHRLCAAARGDANSHGWGSYLGGMWSSGNQTT